MLEMFMKIARYLNNINRGKFNEEELNEYSEEYFSEFYDSLVLGVITPTLKSLYEELFECDVLGDITTEEFYNEVAHFYYNSLVNMANK